MASVHSDKGSVVPPSGGTLMGIVNAPIGNKAAYEGTAVRDSAWRRDYGTLFSSLPGGRNRSGCL